MPLREGDLIDTVLKKISVDEFEPKTGKEKDVAVIGFYLNSESAGQDLYNFISSSVIENRDIELSPNANEDGYYMVFVEIDRKDGLMDSVIQLASEVERVSGKLNWEIKTPYLEEYVSLKDAHRYVQQNSEEYLDASSMKDKLSNELEKATSDSEPDETEANESIMEFLHNSNLLDVNIAESMLTLKDARGILNLEIVNFGYGPDVMSELGISESAIKLDPDQALFDKLKSMLGEMKALPIDNYVVIYDPAHKDVLITKPC